MKKLLLFCLLPTFLFAQPAADLYVSFPASSAALGSDTVKLWLHIPANYPLSGGGVMVGLHGLGDPNNSPDIRTYLTATSDNYGLLLACPEPYLGQENATLIAKSKAVVAETLDSLHAWYNTALNQTYMCGYSAGSDVAAHYTLENPPHPVKGLIWYAPGFYGSVLAPNIDTAFAAPIPPICLCRGTNDAVSSSGATKIESIFSGSEVPFLKVSPAGIGHTMNYPAFTTDIATCMNFINNQYATGIAENAMLKAKVFPNPATDKLFIETENNAAVYAEVADVSGRILFAENFPADASKTIALRSFTNGIYFGKLITNQGNYSFKFLKQ